MHSTNLNKFLEIWRTRENEKSSQLAVTVPRVRMKGERRAHLPVALQLGEVRDVLARELEARALARRGRDRELPRPGRAESCTGGSSNRMALLRNSNE